MNYKFQVSTQVNKLIFFMGFGAKPRNLPPSVHAKGVDTWGNSVFYLLIFFNSSTKTSTSSFGVAQEVTNLITEFSSSNFSQI